MPASWQLLALGAGVDPEVCTQDPLSEAQEGSRQAAVWLASGGAHLLPVKLWTQEEAMRNHISGWGAQGKEKAGLTFRSAANAAPKVALTSTRSRIQAGSFARTGGRAYRWSRSTMLAKSPWCRMALPGGTEVGLLDKPAFLTHPLCLLPSSPLRWVTWKVRSPFLSPPAAPSIPSDGQDSPRLTYGLVDGLHAQILHQRLSRGGLSRGPRLGR